MTSSGATGSSSPALLHQPPVTMDLTKEAVGNSWSELVRLVQMKWASWDSTDTTLLSLCNWTTQRQLIAKHAPIYFKIIKCLGPLKWDFDEQEEEEKERCCLQTEARPEDNWFYKINNFVIGRKSWPHPASDSSINQTKLVSKYDLNWPDSLTWSLIKLTK